MIKYLIKRLLLMIPTLFGITVITFAVINLAPGDPAALKAQSATDALKSEAAAAEVVAQTQKLYGLDRPMYVRYGKWLAQIARLDFGYSYRDHRPVIKKIADALPITLTLNILTILIVYTISIPVGAYAAVKAKSLFDRICALVLFVLYSLPSFWVAMMLIVLLGGGDYLNLFPIVGFVSENASRLSWLGWVGNVAWHLVLPVTCLTYASFAFLSRFQRASMLEVIRQDYIKMARAKGLPEWRVIWHHAMRNSLIPLVTLMGTLLPSLLGGSVIVEQIFAIPGMGRLGFESVLARDYPVIMALAFIGALLTLIGILLSDLMYVIVDPRITFKRQT